ncbi:MAG: relaxase MobL [Oscillospiraceae bacterium]|nr:relaxase MobL [Oscillospiraceae bacterium]
MPKIIVTSRYLKSGSKQKSNYVKYIATRKGSVAVKLNNANAPVTFKQQALIASLIKDFPESKKSFAYSNYTSNSTQQKASVLISEILEHNADCIATRENYVGYLAKRPGAVKFGTHGLFSQENTPIDLNAVMKEVGSHTGNVWTHVVSLRRTDAQRMGYDNLTAWRELVKRQIPNIAKQSKIDLVNLKWYAAFHDKETNPHVHIVIYSTNPKEGFLTKQGIEKIRSGFANDIYHDESYHLYGQQTDVRDQLKNLSSDLMKKLSEQISVNQNPDAELLRLISLLYQQLSEAKGKKVYSYLKPKVKKTVDLIFARLAQNETIQQMYSQWCVMEQTKHDVYSSAKVDFPELTDNPEFKSIKNMIVKTVSNMKIMIPSETEFFFDPNESKPEETSDFKSEFINTDTAYKIEWSKEYKLACQLFHQKEKSEEEKQKCLKLFQAEADAGNVFALYELGKLYDSDFLGESDAEKSQEYYTKALKVFLDLEKLDSRMKNDIQYCIGKMFQNGLGTKKDVSTAIKFFKKAAESKNQWAEFQLGRIFLFGADGIKPDRQQAVKWLTLSAEHGNSYAQEMLNRMEQHQNQILADTSFGLFVNLSRIINDNYQQEQKKLQSHVDSKLKRIIQKKKQELGIRESSNQTPTY